MNRNILEDLERTAALVPDRIAFCDDHTAITFAQLYDMARSVGSRLAEVLPMRSVVAVLMNGRSMDCIPAFLGIVYAGGAYAPLDPSMPKERMELILSIMKPDCILADENGIAALSLLENQQIRVIGYAQAVQTAIDQSVLDRIRTESSMYDPLSILYTSGSTGIPKGSVQSHSSYIHYSDETIQVFHFDENVVFGNQSPFFYGNSVIDIYPPIALGARVYLLPSNALAFPARFIECLREHHVTELTMTPSSFIAIANSEVFQPGCLSELKYGIMSGERMPWRPLMQWMKAAPNAGFYNFYGSTEAFSVAVSKVEGEHDDGELLPVGKPYRHVHIVFIDEKEQEADPLTGGEMLISNPWLSIGYHRNAERTQAVFLVDPMKHGYFERFYRTGDIGRLNEKGELLVLGRKDTQIKHHGYRMELGEVENALRGISGWTDGCVLFDKESGQMYCFWTGALPQTELQTGLKAKLQRYMLPDFYVHLDEMPHTATMKIDRVALHKTYIEKMS